jgi:hypothetical protein
VGSKQVDLERKDVLHASLADCPSKVGDKWASNKWIWYEKMFYTPP